MLRQLIVVCIHLKLAETLSICAVQLHYWDQLAPIPAASDTAFNLNVDKTTFSLCRKQQKAVHVRPSVALV